MSHFLDWRVANTGMFVIVFTTLALLVSGGIFWAFRVETASSYQHFADLEIKRIDRRIAAISNRIVDLVSDLNVLADSVNLQTYINQKNPGDIAKLNQDLSVLIEAKQIYDQARYIDETGMERVRVDLSNGKARVIAGDRLQNKGSRYFFTDTVKLKQGEVFISPFDLNVEGGQVEVPFKPMIRLATPLFNIGGQQSGIAILNYYGNDLLQRLNFANEKSGTPVIELLNRDGYWLKSENPEREWGFMFKRKETFASAYPALWQQMQEANSGQVEADGALWTWARVYPLGGSMHSSTGSANTKGQSEAAIAAQHYYWIAVSRMSTKTLAPAGSITSVRYWLLWSGLMLFAALASWMIALRQGLLDISNKALEQKILEIEAEVVARRQAEASMEEAMQAADAANRAKSDFLANMSHEIRTPMNSIIGLSNLCLQTDLTAKQSDYLHKVYMSAQSLLGIINDILDFSKIEAGKLSLEHADFDLRDIIEECAAMLAERAHAKGVELAAAIPPDLPQVVGDAGRVRQILLNLIGNAVKFTDRGEVVVSVHAVEPVGSEELRLRFEVKDTGIGIAAEVRDQIFEAFSQADGSTTRRYGGTGLGLAICRKLVSLMGGEIGLADAPGPGSTFAFVLPFAVSRTPVLAYPPPDLSGLKVLLVDDHPTSRQILERQLQAWGCRCDQAGNGDDALAMLLSAEPGLEPYRLAVLDWHMPGMDGFELARRIRREKRLDELRLVMLGSALPDRTAEAAGETGIAQFLTKPVRQAQLIDCLHKVMGSDVAEPAIAEVQANPPLDADVLLVEDSAVNQEVARRMLELAGCRVRVASQGLEALALLEQWPFDLVFMDCHMPEMDGFSATRTIRRRGMASRHGGRLPVIALTANVIKGTEDECLAAGMDDYLAKPFRRDQIQTMVHKWLERPASPPPSPATAEDTMQTGPSEVLDRVTLDAVRALNSPGSPDLLVHIAGIFRDQAPQFLARIDAAVRTLDGNGLRESAHTLKSSSANVGALGLVALCRQLEELGRSGRPQEAAALLARLHREMERVDAALADLTATPSQPVVPAQ